MAVEAAKLLTPAFGLKLKEAVRQARLKRMFQKCPRTHDPETIKDYARAFIHAHRSLFDQDFKLGRTEASIIEQYTRKYVR
jgi:hypothetical protein